MEGRAPLRRPPLPTLAALAAAARRPPLPPEWLPLPLLLAAAMADVTAACRPPFLLPPLLARWDRALSTAARSADSCSVAEKCCGDASRALLVPLPPSSSGVPDRDREEGCSALCCPGQHSGAPQVSAAGGCVHEKVCCRC